MKEYEAKLTQGQLGYSIDSSGTSLIDDTAESWKPNWLVIGYEDGSANPIFIDTEEDGFPVYTSEHGTGSWRPNLIATGLRTFATIMNELAQLAEGRETPVTLQANPIHSQESIKFWKT